MVLEQVFGLSATSITLHERFSYLAKRPRTPRTPKWQPQPTINPALIHQIAQQFEFQLNEQMQLQNLDYGIGRTRRYSEGSVTPLLYRSGSMDSLNDDCWDDDSVSWRGSMGNLSTTSSGRYFKMRPNHRGRRRGFHRGAGLMRIQNRLGRPNIVGRQAGRTRGGRGRGRARGNLGVTRNEKPVPTKEQLDEELDKYMASCKSRLDKELDEYRQSADMDVDMLE